jgi:ABC-type polar amino acid transport system ATPase subunit
MIIVTHDISFAKKISDKVLFINEGSVCECGYVNDVFENPQKEETKKFLKDYL